MLLRQYQKIVFIGDSITDCERRSVAAPYGNGYVNIVRSLIQARYPQLHLSFVNKGIGGETVRELDKRWQQDVIEEQPDWLSIKIGINDAHREVPLTEYEATLRRLLDMTRRECRTSFVLMQPYLIEPDQTDVERIRMDRYGAVMKMIASAYDAVLVETQAAFDSVLRSTRPTDWAQDRVHPDTPGHAVIALAFLRAIGFKL